MTEEACTHWFKTARGSLYEVRGLTTLRHRIRTDEKCRFKTQVQSERTYYVPLEYVLKFSFIRRPFPEKKYLRLTSSGLLGLYEKVEDRYVWIKHSYLSFSNAPVLGYIPLETWNNGNQVHIGDPIIQEQIGYAQAFDALILAVKRGRV